MVLNIQKNFSKTSKTVHIYAFYMFVLETVVKIDHVSVQENISETLFQLVLSILADCVKLSET